MSVNKASADLGHIQTFSVCARALRAAAIKRDESIHFDASHFSDSTSDRPRGRPPRARCRSPLLRSFRHSQPSETAPAGARVSGGHRRPTAVVCSSRDLLSGRKAPWVSASRGRGCGCAGHVMGFGRGSRLWLFCVSAGLRLRDPSGWEVARGARRTHRLQDPPPCPRSPRSRELSVTLLQECSLLC